MQLYKSNGETAFINEHQKLLFILYIMSASLYV